MKVLATVVWKLMMSIENFTCHRDMQSSPSAYHLSLQSVTQAAVAYFVLISTTKVGVCDVMVSKLPRRTRCSDLRWYG